MESWAHRDTMEPKGSHLEAHSLDVGDLKTMVVLAMLEGR